MKGFLEQLAQATGQESIEVHYEVDLLRRMGGGELKDFRAKLERCADVLPLPDVLQGKVPPQPGQRTVFVVVSTLREGFWVRVWRMRPLVTLARSNLVLNNVE